LLAASSGLTNRGVPIRPSRQVPPGAGNSTNQPALACQIKPPIARRKNTAKTVSQSFRRRSKLLIAAATRAVNVGEAIDTLNRSDD